VVTHLEPGSFEEFFAVASPRLRRAFVAAYGSERGRDAAAEALGYAWEHWSRVRKMENPFGYLYRVGQSRTRPRRNTTTALVWDVRDHDDAYRVEPGLGPALASLSEQQRVAVVLVRGYGWALREVADLSGVTVSTVQTHVDRALGKLRAALEVAEDV
jgi:DNA-directed RNA polymerase specialized sigma24 family protein